MPSLAAASEETKDALIVQCTNNFIELTSTQRKDHQVVTYLRSRHSVFPELSDGEIQQVDHETPPASYREVVEHCQISESELRDLLAQKALDYQIIRLAGDKCAFVSTRCLVELVDSLLLALCTREDMVVFSASDILSR